VLSPRLAVFYRLINVEIPERKLRYYRSSSSSEPNGFIDFAIAIEVKIGGQTKRKGASWFTFEIVTLSRTMVLAAKTEQVETSKLSRSVRTHDCDFQERNDWVAACSVLLTSRSSSQKKDQYPFPTRERLFVPFILKK